MTPEQSEVYGPRPFLSTRFSPPRASTPPLTPPPLTPPPSRPVRDRRPPGRLQDYGKLDSILKRKQTLFLKPQNIKNIKIGMLM